MIGIDCSIFDDEVIAVIPLMIGIDCSIFDDEVIAVIPLMIGIDCSILLLLLLYIIIYI